MKKFTILLLLAVFGLSGFYKSYSQSQWSLAKSYNLDYPIQCLDCNEKYFFNSSSDTIFVYDIETGTLIHSETIGTDYSFAFVINDKLFARQGLDKMRYYDISNINNWNLVQTLAGFDNGWNTKLTNDTSYIAWVGHWAQTYQMIDITGPSMVLKCKVNTGGNSYTGGTYGNFIYASSAYNQCARIDISSPSNCTVTNFGASFANNLWTTITGLIVYDEGYASINRIKIYNQDNILTGQTTIASDPAYVLPDNYCIVRYPDSLNLTLYDIDDGTFDNPINSSFTSNTYPRSHNSKYLIASNGNVVELYYRFDNANNSLVAHYPFNGNANDESGNGNDGTVNGATLTTDRFGNPNSAYYYDGTDEIRVSSSTSLENFTDNISISTWVNIENYYQARFPVIDKHIEVLPTAGRSQCLLIASDDPNEGFGFQSICEIIIYGNANQLPPINEWLHIVSVYDGDSVYIYSNGIKSFANPATGNICVNNGDLIIGHDEFGNDEWAIGKIDDISIYNRTLSQQEIDSLYHEGGWGTNTDIVAHYPFNGNANDESGNGNDGTVNGATLTEDRFGNPNSAYDFDGMDDYIQLPTNTYFDGNFAISGWVNLRTYNHCVFYDFGNGNADDNVRTIFSLPDEAAYHTQLFEGTSGDNLFCDDQIPLNVWTHSVITLNANQLSFYIDGDHINTVTTNYIPLNVQRTINYFAVSSYYGSDYTDAILDDISIYNKALSVQEIDSLYNIGGWISLNAEFIVSDTLGQNPLNVDFTDLSTGNPTSWQWDFNNDGTIDSEEQNPEWTYTEPGTYSVSLTVSDGENEDTELKEDYITVNPIYEQDIVLSEGYSFVSSHIIAENPDMLNILQNNLTNIEFVRNNEGQMLVKIWQTWVNNIGDWINTEGYLFKMYNNDQLTIIGDVIDPQTPINLTVGYQMVSYLPEQPGNALDMFEGVLENLDFVRNTGGFMIQKIGPIWVNSIGDMQPNEGYLVKMNAPDVLIYPEETKSALINNYLNPEHFIIENSNPYDPVWSIYFEKGSLSVGDEIGVYDGENLAGADVVVSDNIFENAIPVFSNLYEAGNKPIIKVWNKNENKEYILNDYTFSNPYGDAWMEDVFPAEDGEYSLLNFSTTGISNEMEMNQIISIYPNPTTGIITVGNLGNLSGLEITDITGKKVFQTCPYEPKQVRTRRSKSVWMDGSKIINYKSSIEIDLSMLEKGIYFISFSGKDINQVKKIVVQ